MRDLRKIDKLLSQTVTGTPWQLATALYLSYHAARGSVSLSVPPKCVARLRGGKRAVVISEVSSQRWPPSGSHCVSGLANPPQLDFVASDFRGCPPNALAVSQQPQGHLWRESEDNCSFELS